LEGDQKATVAAADKILKYCLGYADSL
jgi:hypothetical protein